MVILKGQFNTAKVFSDNLDEVTIDQIKVLLNQEFVKGSQIRIMPDAHAGAGSTIGTTITVHDKVVPYMVGVDIGCGMKTAILKDKHIDYQDIDRLIHEIIPAGFRVRSNPHEMVDLIEIENLKCADHVNMERAYNSIGTLGGGNHFIEINQDEEGTLYLVIHTGSRHLGTQVAEHYQNIAFRECRRRGLNIEDKFLTWLDGNNFDDYIHDMEITQHYADINRQTILTKIVEGAGLEVEDSFSTVHNYIDTEDFILRKGAISAKAGERVLIPLNMRDGSLLCVGKGNQDWNYSAPHGAGRLMSRRQARRQLNMEDFRKSMKNVYSTTVDTRTLDEAPFAYKPMKEIIENTTDTITVNHHLKPLYNFKSTD